MRGIVDGLPICFGYFPVAFAFGVTSVGKGLSPLQAILISMTNVTSAGQLAGVGVIAAGGAYIEMALTQFIINLRYSVMSLTLSQKFDDTVRLRDRFLIAFINTDEVFAVSQTNEGNVGRKYMYGLILTPFLGWTLGTVVGSFFTDLFSKEINSALGIALFAMFIAIVTPVVRKNVSDLLCVAFAVALSCAFTFVPRLNAVPSGFVIIICSVTAAAVFAMIDVSRKRGRA